MERHRAHARDPDGTESLVDALSRSFAELHAGLREEREQRRVDVEHLAQSVVARVDECQASVDDEQVQRLERGGNAETRWGGRIRLQEKVDGERGVRGRMAELGTIIDAAARRQETHDDVSDGGVDGDRRHQGGAQRREGGAGGGG